MDKNKWLAAQFQTHREHLQDVAYRMLGSMSEADDAVQECWLRASLADTTGVANFGGWLTTIIGRICLDALRTRKRRREEPLEVLEAKEKSTPIAETSLSPDQVVQITDSVGRALLVILENLSPAERVAYVLHDMFDLPFDEIAPILTRTAETTRQLASRARRRIRNGGTLPEADRARQWKLLDAYLTAARIGDFDGLIALLDPDVVVRADEVAAPAASVRQARGATRVAKSALRSVARGTNNRLVLVNGAAGLAEHVDGKPVRVVEFVIGDLGILDISVIADPATLRALVITHPDHAPMLQEN